jgi:hypothetical protein
LGNLVFADAEDSKYAKDLQAEKAGIESRLLINPNDDEANLLYAVTLFLDLAESPNFKNLLTSIGVSNSIANFTLNDNWDNLDEDHDFELDTSSNSSEIFSYLNDTLQTQVNSIDSHLAKVSTSALITLTKEQTGADDEVFVDYTDVLVFRAINKVVTAHFQIVYAYGPSFSSAEVKALDDNNFISLESIRDLNTNFGKVVSTTSLTNAKTNIKEAIALYQTASPLLRNSTRMAQDRLFNLDSEYDLEEEEEFLEALEEILTALDNQHNFDDENDPEETIDLSQFFAGKLDFSVMLPESVGDSFANATVSDPTFGGIFPNWTQAMITEDLIEESDISNDLWKGAASLGSDWWHSHWWGTFYAPNNAKWLYHYPLGWMYQASKTPGDIWFYNTELKWLWTNSRIFPFIYEYGESGSNPTWLYYMKSTNVLWEQSAGNWKVKE